MFEVTLHKPRTATPFDLNFHALSQYGEEMPPAGPVTWVSASTEIANVQEEQPFDPCTITLVGVVGTCDITATDGVETVVIHLIVDAVPDVETSATVTED